MKRCFIVVTLAVALVAAPAAQAAWGDPWRSASAIRKSLLRDGVKHLYGDRGPRVVVRAYCEGFGRYRVAWNGVRLFRKFLCIYQYRNGAIWFSEIRTRRDFNAPNGWSWVTTHDELLQDSWGNVVGSL